jgi:CDP-glucose 4,6-dehydratase
MLGIEDDLVQVEGDLCDGAELERVLRENRVDTAFHLAAETIVSTVRDSPVQGFESNMRGIRTLLQACLEGGVDRVVFASSDKAYERTTSCRTARTSHCSRRLPTRPRRPRPT